MKALIPGQVFPSISNTGFPAAKLQSFWTITPSILSSGWSVSSAETGASAWLQAWISCLFVLTGKTVQIRSLSFIKRDRQTQNCNPESGTITIISHTVISGKTVLAVCNSIKSAQPAKRTAPIFSCNYVILRYLTAATMFCNAETSGRRSLAQSSGKHPVDRISARRIIAFRGGFAAKPLFYTVGGKAA